ncbi:MAG: AAA family ATPase [Sarcina sp.]
MIIKKIILKNFRSYEDETTFDFSPKDGKNIVLIGGENGAGKSTLFQAIKICFYGPLSYGYIGQNSTYISKVKSNINHNAFKGETVNAFVSIDIQLKEGTEQNSYTLTRSWNYLNQKLNESFKVSKNDELLSDEETLYFHNYLKTVIPPSLFEFFFFDGEDLAEHFVGSSANIHIKDALLQLCNYDTFEILKKSLLQYQRANNSLDADIKEKQEKYDELLSSSKDLQNFIDNLEIEINKNKFEFEELNIKKEKLAKDFKEAGGLLEEEKGKLTQTYANLEKEREELNIFIKNYCNNTLPFMITKKLLSKIKNQLGKEKELASYEAMKTKLNEDVLKEVASELDGINDNINYSNFSNILLGKMFSNDIIENNVKSIHKLSFEQENSVHNTINIIDENFEKNKTDIKDKYVRLAKIAKKIKTIRSTLTSSLEDKILENYLTDTESLNNQLSNLSKKISLIEVEINNKIIEKGKLDNLLVRARNEYTSARQSTDALALSEDAIKCLNDIISKLTFEKTNIIEKEFINIFNKLIRKDSYIDSIKFNENFTPTLYIDKDYSRLEIANLIRNLGMEDLEKKYGKIFVETLYDLYNTQSKNDLIKELESNPFGDLIRIATKVNVNDFSSGEKQMYILCLIWALIKTSDIEVPFIIDTPYARIDETHRNALTTAYLPNISNQVIILSTNEEIDHDSYLLIQKYLCNEYLLEYLNKERKTVVHNKYFFEVN